MPTAVEECACWQRSRDHMISPHAGPVRRVRSEERSRTEGDSRGKCSREQQQEAKLTRGGGSGSQAAMDRQPKTPPHQATSLGRRRCCRLGAAAAAAAAHEAHLVHQCFEAVWLVHRLQQDEQSVSRAIKQGQAAAAERKNERKPPSAPARCKQNAHHVARHVAPQLARDDKSMDKQPVKPLFCSPAPTASCG